MDETSFSSMSSSVGDGRELALVNPLAQRGDGSSHGGEMIEILSERDDAPIRVLPHEAGEQPDPQDLRRFVWYLMEENDKLKVELVEARRQNQQGVALLTELDQVMMNDIDQESKQHYLENYHQSIEMRRKNHKKGKKEKGSKKKAKLRLTNEGYSELDKSWPNTSMSTVVTASTSDMTQDSDNLSDVGERDMPRDLYIGQDDSGEESLTIEYLKSRGKQEHDDESTVSLAPPSRATLQQQAQPSRIEVKGEAPRNVTHKRNRKMAKVEPTQGANGPALTGIVCNHTTFVHCVIVHGHDEPIKVMEEWP